MIQSIRFRRLLAVLIVMTLLPLSSLAATKEGTVSTSSLILRQSASKNSKALQTLSRGETVIITDSKGDWYKVIFGNYTGYVMKDYIKVSGGSSSSSSSSSSSHSSSSSSSSSGKHYSMDGIHSIKDIGDPPSTCRPGDTGNDVAKLQMALKLKGYYKSSIDGVYGDGTKSAVKSFQKAKGLSADGIAGKSTISRLFGESSSSSDSGSASSSSSGGTERLDWFNGGSSKIPKGATFTVKDCKTGKSFQCKRWSGSCHIDAEPVSSSDTSTLLSIYGGSINWRRRAVLVKYNGHVYAASIYAEPHGTNTITSNHFDGHFCIHFYGSTTHGTKKVDSDHQNAITTAMKYSW